jgi:D-glycero-D-manno-heptose 1,7-bisphosphate phosphatase
MSEQDLAEIHDQMLAELTASGAPVEAIFYCPHDEGECSCRKPNIGLFLKAERELPHLNLARSVVIGDSVVDVQAAARLGVPSILISPNGSAGPTVPLAYRATSLLDAVTWLTACARG